MAKKIKAKAKKSVGGGVIRAAIVNEVKARGLTGYQMVGLLEGKVSRTAVYRFLSDGGTTDIATAEAFFNVLDLTVVKK